MVQNYKNFCRLRSISQKPYIIWLTFMICMGNMIISPGVFFIFSKILIFQIVSGVKGQKMTQNDEQFCLPCLPHLIFQESCIIWSSFMRHMCKRKIYSGIFFIFSKFWFSCPKWQKILSVSLRVAGTIHHMIMIHISKMMISPAIFFVFFLILIFQGVFFRGGGEGEKGKKLPIITNFSLSHSMSQELWIISSRFLVHRCKIMISPSVLLFLKKYNFVNINNLTFFIDPLQQLF